MLFGKRRWATGVAIEAGLDPRSPVGKAAINLMVVGAKKAQRMVRGSGPRGDMDDLDFVIMCARALPDDSTALSRMRGAGVSDAETRPLLRTVATAAVRFYQDEGRDLGAPRPARFREPWAPPAR